MNLFSFLKSLMYVVGANALSLIVSVVSSIVVPMALGTDLYQYGLYQIYVFYVSYVGFFHFGLADGIFLRAGGYLYEKLDKRLYASQFWILVVGQIILGIGVVLVCLLTSVDGAYSYIWSCIGVAAVLTNSATLLTMMLQATNRILEYSVVSSIGRISYCAGLVAILLSHICNFYYLILGDLLGKLVTLIVAAYFSKEIVFSKPVPLRAGIREAKTNISVGISLMIAQIANMLITGIVRAGIQFQWDEIVFGKVSFSLSITNLFMVFISAISLVLYPTLKREEKEITIALYPVMRSVLMVTMFAAMAFCIPIQKILYALLPQYRESIRYLSILLPVCVYASKMSVLVQTYMQIHRYEKDYLRINLWGIAVAGGTMLISVFLLKNLTLAVLSIVINQCWRCFIGERMLSKQIGIRYKQDSILELLVTGAFIASHLLINDWGAMIVYVIAFGLYCYFKREAVAELLKRVVLIGKHILRKR